MTTTETNMPTKRKEDLAHGEMIRAGGAWWFAWDFKPAWGPFGGMIGWEVRRDGKLKAFVGRGDTRPYLTAAQVEAGAGN